MAGVQIQRRISAVTFTIPANTLSSAPSTSNLDLGQTQISTLRVRIPRGHVGLTGFAFRYGGTRIVPWDNTSQWITGDDEIFDIEVYLDVSVPITLVGFNTDVIEHGFELRFLLDDSVYLQPQTSGLIIPQ